MFGLKDFSINFLTGAPVLVSLALVGLLALAVFLYYRTNPPLPRFWRVLMGALRVVAVLSLLAMLLEPVISYVRDFERPRRISILLDRSLSMDRVESNLSRRARLDSLLSSESFNRLKQTATVTPFYFGGNITTEQDKVQTDRTALGDALYDLKARQMTEPADAWLLFSDGKSNSGRTVAEAAATIGIPTTTIDMASSAAAFDVAIENVDYNNVLFVGQPAEIKVRIGWRNAAGKTVRLSLLGGDGAAPTADFPITESSGKADITLKYIPTQPGQRLLRVSMPALPGEESDRNNSRTISVKVLKSRLQVLIATARPDYEIGFLRRQLLRSDNYGVDLCVTGPREGNLSKRFPSSQTELNRYDLVVLYDPDPSAYERVAPLLKSYLSDKGGAIWVMMGEQFAAQGPVKWFNDLLPFSQSTRSPIQYFDFQGEPSENDLFHPAVRLADSRTAIREAWNNLPPFKSLVRCDVIDPNSTQLVYAALPSLPNARTPIIGYRRFGPGKLLACAALPFWPWGFQSIGMGGSDSVYVSFINGTVRWLTTRDDFDPIRVTPEKEVFSRGEPVKFDAYAYDQGYRPIPGVTGTVTLKESKSGVIHDADMVERSEGRLDASFDQIPPGHYSFTATLSRDGQELKKSEGSVAVEEFSLEEYDQSGDPAALASLARLTGGNSYTYSQFSDAVSSMNLAPVQESITGEIVLWNKFWLLALFVICLSVEWVIRKLQQLI
ncbi:hypothetical protein C3F09_08500 [candidate division GN15 bacterium]|uniref:VWA domain-containing protein n=1 Tax=candidate division GN15 bacterium TaxID=2072418 RepID=A0A855WYZ7_9BACT|nr:MAG: hypothetical protein C3F09_08500 [candidate division GN15 bacterium]